MALPVEPTQGRTAQHLSDIVAVVVVIGLGLAACGTSAPIPSSMPTAPASVATGQPTGRPTLIPTARAACTNPDGGVCLNTLAAGTYTTATFVPQLTYTVPNAWQNLEDTPGNFLLVAPGYSLAGVNAGGSDFIGVYTSVRAENRKCATDAEAGSDQPGIAHTPAAMTAEFQVRPGLVATKPTPVSVGGLTGLVMDLQMKASWTGTCFYAQTPVVQLIGGVAPSGLDHPLVPGLTMRLYLLGRGDSTLAIEIDDYAGGAHLASYSKIVEMMQFGH